jgi:hypothetical protein
VPIPNSNMCSVSVIVFQVKECIFLIRKFFKKLQIKLQRTTGNLFENVENCKLRKKINGRS